MRSPNQFTPDVSSNVISVKLTRITLLEGSLRKARNHVSTTDDLAKGTNQRFHHTQQTTATPDAIWARWSDPASWGEWDKGLKQADLTGRFEVGATGTIVPLKGPKASFVIESVNPGVSYTFATSMPAATLRVERELLNGTTTTFRHTVWFDGPMAWLFSRLYGKQFRAALPPTMRELAALAEADG